MDDELKKAAREYAWFANMVDNLDRDPTGEWCAKENIAIIRLQNAARGFTHATAPGADVIDLREALRTALGAWEGWTISELYGTRRYQSTLDQIENYKRLLK